MSPRRNRPRPGALPAERPGGPLFGHERTVDWRGEEWTVRQVSGSAGKYYRCPGCDQEIPPGTGHVVAWPEYGGVDDRRHWHGSCWNARDRRSAKLQRSRNAPRH
ncbi:ATP/GTP-binding protein [Streptomyces sp. HB2AG]|uniref:ATP/GTP-binding protein n=1 Tax=Streptomyces sp. HB2AG TaxID=2983400 RepID=UPI0022AB2594|nr:ATP/GTP-binding protein [Streptomyces sp. HB2AG]MCZ2524264.1 ATP/GTP-binding protein [Streptomyces sp. HB2AG]